MDLERRHGDSKEAVESGKWIQVQKRIFTRWANAYLKLRKLHITDLCTDLKDGLLLVQLLEILARQPFPYKVHEKPKMEIHEHENLKAAFRFMTERGLEFRNIGAIDVHQGNEKIILGLIWTIISFFQVGEISLDGVSGRDGLLLWAQRNTQGFAGVEVTDFSKSWKDGLAWCALVAKYRPDVIDFASLNPANNADNLALAFQLAEDYFGIDRILDVEDILEAAKPDEKIVITYVAFCFKGYADYLRRQGLAKAIGKAVDITVKHDAWILQYNAEAQALSEWIAASTAAYSSHEHGACVAEIKATFDQFNTYKSSSKPEWKAKKTQLDGLYNTFVSSARNNNRPIYQPPAGLSPAELEAAWVALEECENSFDTSVRTMYSDFLALEYTIDQFTLKHGKTEAWMDAQLATFSRDSFGDSLTATESFLAAFAAYEKQRVHFRGVLTTLRSWATGNGMERHQRHAELVATVEASEAKFASVETAGVAYKTQLDRAAERHTKFAVLQKISTWIDQQNARFDSAVYGETLMETNALLEEQSAWSVNVGPKQEMLSGVTSDQIVIMERQAQVQAQFQAMEARAGEYREYLILRQEQFEKFDILDKVAGWIDTQENFFGSADYGSDLAAVADLLSSYRESFQANLAAKKEVLAGMTSGQESILARMEEINLRLTAVEGLGDNYHSELLLSQERHEKLPALDRVSAFIAKHNAVFASGEFGDTLVAVATLMSAFDTYRVNVPAQQEVLANMASAQQVILDRLTQVRGEMAALEAAAAAYHQQLLLSQERLEKLPALDRVVAWLDVQNALFAAGEYGDSLVAVATLLESYATFTRQLAAHKEVVDSMSTAQPVVAERLAAARAAVVSTSSAGEAYHLQVCLSQERLEKLPALDKLDAWADTQNALFQAGNYGTSLAEVAQLQEDHMLYAAGSARQQESLARLASEQPAIATRRAEVEAKLAETEAAAQAYGQALEQTRAHYQHLLDLSSQYNNEANDFMFKADDLESELQQPIFSGSIDSIQAMITKFGTEIQASITALTDLYNAIDGMARELLESGMNDAFSRFTLNDLYEKFMAVYGLSQGREAELQSELAAEQAKDDLRRHFAETASAVRQFCDPLAAEVGQLAGDLDEQLARVQAMQTSHAGCQNLLAAAEESTQALAAAGILDNRYTPETIFSLRATYEALGKVLAGAEEALRGQIMATRGEKITAEQLREIREVFEAFDVDRDHALSRKEFYSCCTGIGIVMTEDEVRAPVFHGIAPYMRERARQQLTKQIASIDVDGDGTINFDEFTAFMIARLQEPGHSMDDVLAAFRDLADKDPYVTSILLQRTFSKQEHLTYLRTNMPPSGVAGAPEGAYEFDSFVHQLFSR